MTLKVVATGDQIAVSVSGINERVDLVLNGRTKSMRARLMKRMKWGIHTLYIGAVVAVLATSALACPVWMGMQDGGMPCSQDQNNPPQCPFTVCLASSSYVSARQINTSILPSQELNAAVTVPTIFWTSLGPAQPAQRSVTSPHGLGPPLFLQTHSLLI